MKSKLLLVIFFVCFSLFLFLGIRASQAVFDEDQPSASDFQTSSGPVLLQEQAGEPAPLDPFTLIILVDDLESLNPLLEGVWLHRATDGGRGAMFFPIFPSQADDGLERDLNLRGAFWFGETHQPSQQFRTILSDRNLNWHQTLMLDHNALNEIGLILAEMDPSYQPLNSVGLAGLAFSVENRLNVQSNQGLFIHDLCKAFPFPSHNELLQRFLEGFAGHLRLSGTTPLHFTRSWQAVSYCLFPTLSLPIQ
jgi:hypothetical protein